MSQALPRITDQLSMKAAIRLEFVKHICHMVLEIGRLLDLLRQPCHFLHQLINGRLAVAVNSLAHHLPVILNVTLRVTNLIPTAAHSILKVPNRFCHLSKPFKRLVLAPFNLPPHGIYVCLCVAHPRAQSLDGGMELRNCFAQAFSHLTYRALHHRKGLLEHSLC